MLLNGNKRKGKFSLFLFGILKNTIIFEQNLKRIEMKKVDLIELINELSSNNGLKALEQDFLKLMGVCGLKRACIVKREKFQDNGSKIYYHDSDYVMFTTTQATIIFDEEITTSMFNKNDQYQNIGFRIITNAVAKPYIQELPILGKFLQEKYSIDSGVNEIRIFMNARKYLNIDKFTSVTFGEYVVSEKSGMINFNKPSIKPQEFTADELHSLGSNIDKVIQHLIQVMENTPKETLESFRRGLNEFKPNIINDLKYGGNY